MPLKLSPDMFQRTMKAQTFTFIFNFLEAGIKVVLVVDGQHKPPVKRLQRRNYSTQDLINSTLYEGIAKALNVPVVHAPGEGEAQCAHMQRRGCADFAFSADSDVIIFGAKNIVRSLIGEGGKLAKRYAVYEIPSTHRWAAPSKLLCYAILRGGDYDKGSQQIGDVRAVAIAQTGNWADRLFKIANAMKGIKCNIAILVPEMANLESYSAARIHQHYAFSEVPELLIDVEWFIKVEWLTDEDDNKQSLRMARVCLVYQLKNNEDPDLFTFVNQKDKSVDKEVYEIKYCPISLWHYPHHKCHPGCKITKSSVSASLLMQSKYDHKQRYIDMVEKKSSTRKPLANVDTNTPALKRSSSKAKLAKPRARKTSTKDAPILLDSDEDSDLDKITLNGSIAAPPAMPEIIDSLRLTYLMK
ncbi:Flap endonuclease 1 [Yarrowia sp. B02]|nr:Flap endonuclease 1 [Yarrowia sp. B02]